MIAKVLDPDDETETTTFYEAVNHPTRGKQWEQAIKEEYESIIKNRTWTLVPRPSNQHVVTCKWVFKHKKDQFGKIIHLKARLVASGFSQIHGVDYLETYAPVAKLVSICILFAIAAAQGLEIHQMDVVMAFLVNILEEKIYMEQAEGFRKGDLGSLLGKSLYGSKQSACI